MSPFWITALCVAVGLHLFALACVCASITSVCEELRCINGRVYDAGEGLISRLTGLSSNISTAIARHEVRLSRKKKRQPAKRVVRK